MDADTQQLLGCLYQEPFIRQPTPKKETKAQRNKRTRESQIWERSVQAMGTVPEHQQWIYVGDRGSDIYTFWQACEQWGYDFVIRLAQDRRALLEEEAEDDDPTIYHLKTLARSLPAQDGRVLQVPAQHHRPARQAFLQIGWQQVRLQPPTHAAKKDQTAIMAWVLHVWEPQPPTGSEPLEWLLVTTGAIHNPEEAWERVKWYKWRWRMSMV